MAIYDLIADKLFLKLQKEDRVRDLSNEFIHIDTDADKVLFADHVWRDSGIKVDIPMCLTKNQATAEEYRKQGNQYFSLKNRNYVKALELYNQSICFAEANSEDIGIAYANRSAIYFEWKKYELSLENIALAKANGYPDRLMDKLVRREQECKKTLDSRADTTDDSEEILLAPKLSYPPHPKLPFIADCLEIRESDRLGRHIVTNQDLSVGKVAAIEESFCSWTLPSVRYQRCANCLQEFDFSLIPCERCTSTMFCSQTCAEEADEQFHRFECPVIDFMYKMLNIIQLSAVRVSICALTSFDNVEALHRFVNDPETDRINTFTLNHSTKLSKAELYKPIHTLETNQSKRTTADLFQRAVITAVIYRALSEHSPLLMGCLEADTDRRLLMELIFRHLQTASTNFHRLETLANARDINDLDNVSYGSGAFGFCSLINHACSPNIVRLPIGRQIAVFVLRPIKAGEELLDNYGYVLDWPFGTLITDELLIFEYCEQFPDAYLLYHSCRYHHSHERLDVRQNQLLSQYKFKCQCMPCQKDYPTFAELQEAKIPTLLTSSDIDNITRLDKHFARQNFSRFCTYLNKYGDNYPCKQISSVEECLKMCLLILINNIPLKLQYP